MNLLSSLCLVALVAVSSCDVVGGDFCKTYDAVVTGKLKLTRAEALALRRATRADLLALKRHYKQHCEKRR